MNFLNPLLLAGVGGAMIPLVLHLLSRSRHRTVDWGAMMFLEPADRRESAWRRLRQWLLVAVRMALVALLAVALARPVTEGRSAVAETGRIGAVLIIDTSASMEYPEATGPRLRLAQEAALGVLSSLRPGDTVALVGTSARAVDLPPTTDLQSAAARVANLEVHHEPADLAHALQRAVGYFAADDGLSREVYVIADRQALSWAGVDAGFARAFAARSGAGSPVRLVVVPVGTDRSDNVAIVEARLADAPAIRGRRGEIEVRLRNAGAVVRPAVPVVVRLGEAKLAEATAHLPPGGEQTLRLPVSIERAGPHTLTVEVAGGGLPADDRFDVALDVLEPLRVLLVTDDPAPDAPSGPAAYVRAALSPYAAAGAAGVDLAAIEVRSLDALPSGDLSAYAAVIVANPYELHDAHVRALEQYAYGGGGVILTPGDLTRARAFNDLLYRDGAGLAPASLAEATPPDGSAATSLLGLEMAHPLFAFARRSASPVPPVVVGRYFPIQQRRTDARTLGSYLSGDPFVVEAPLGRGRVLLLTTSLDARWSSLPQSGFYLPFVQSAVRYVAAGALPERNLAEGQALVATFDAPDAGEGRVLTPAGPRPVSLVRTGGGVELRWTDTRQPGLYTAIVRSGGREHRQPFVVHGGAAEADLAPLGEARLRELQALLRFEWMDLPPRNLAPRIVASRSGDELWLPLLLGVVALAMAEVVLARLMTREAA